MGARLLNVFLAFLLIGSLLAPSIAAVLGIVERLPITEIPSRTFEGRKEMLLATESRNYGDAKSAPYVFSNNIYWRLNPGSELGITSERRYPINAYGFRGPNFSKQKQPGTYRILAMGDSTTFGLFVNDRQTYSALLEESLNRLSLSLSPRFEVINLGVPGYTSFQGRRLLEGDVLNLKPDLLVYYFGSLNESRGSEFTDRELSRLLSARFSDRLWRNATLRLAMNPLERLAGDERPPLVRRVPIPEYEDDLRAIHRQAARKGVNTLMIIPPLSDELQRHYPLITTAYAQAARSAAEEVPSIDASGFFDAESTDALFTADGVHLNAEGHSRIARAILASFWPFQDAIPVSLLDPVSSALLARGSRIASLTAALPLPDNSMYFTGETQVNTGISLTEWHALSVSLWVKVDRKSKERFGIILDNGHTADSNCVIQSDSENDNAVSWVCLGSGLSFRLRPRAWNHLLVTAGGVSNTMSVFLNGALVSSTSLPKPLRLGGVNLTFGRHAVEPRSYFRGQLGGVMLWNRVLSKAEMVGLNSLMQHHLRETGVPLASPRATR